MVEISVEMPVEVVEPEFEVVVKGPVVVEIRLPEVVGPRPVVEVELIVCVVVLKEVVIEGPELVEI